MKNILFVVLTVLALNFTACDDDKKDNHEDCGCPLAGEMMAGEEVAGEEPVEAGEPDMEMPEEGGMPDQMDMEMPEAGEMAPEVPCECEADMMCDC